MKMKNLLKSFVCMLLIIYAIDSFAQKKIDYPQVGFNGTNPNVKITRVVLTDSNTVLYFRTTARPGDWIRIPKNTYIQGKNENDKLFIKGVKGIPFNQQYTMPDSGAANYQLIFPPLKQQVAVIDYGEEQDGGWKIYDIELEQKNRLLPTEFYKEWYNKSNGQLEIAFYNQTVVLDRKVWAYQNVASKGNRFTITLLNNGETKKISAQLIKGNLVYRGSNESIELLANRNHCDKAVDKSVFHEPYLKNDSAVFSGYIKNYTSRLGTKTMSLAVNNIINGTQKPVLIKIQENGYFYQKIPLYHFQQVFLRSDIANENDIYLEPGKELFMVIGGDKPQYMGELAKLNYDLSRLNAIRQFDYYSVQKKVANMKPNEYKAYLTQLQNIENRKLDSVYRLNLISAKAFQVKKLDIKLSYANNMMEYHWIVPSAFKSVNKLPNNEKVIAEQYPNDYYSFIGNDFNKAENLLAPSFNTFINRIRFIENLRQMVSYHYKEIIPLLKKTAYRPDAEDKSFEEYMMANQQSTQIDSAHAQLSEKWANKHGTEIQLITAYILRKQYYAKLQSAIGISEKGILKDLITAQEVSNPMVQQLTPMDENSLAFLLEDVENPFIKEYIFNNNLAITQQVKINKKNGGYFMNSTPTVEADQIFDAILARYKGKVVVVDFWATWCAPCLSGIERIAPLKEDLKDKDVEFVYITNETSPLQTYNNMTPTIKGQHYRLKSDEWRYLADKFSISGIPHMVLVNKEGKVVNPHIAFIENNEMKRLVEANF